MKIYSPAVTLGTNNPDTITPDQAASSGTAITAAREDHAHSIAAAAPGNSDFADVAAEGASASFARADHTHGREVEPRRTMFIPCHVVTGTATLSVLIDDYATTVLGDATADGAGMFSGRLPSDFGTLRAAYVAVRVNDTGNMRYQVDTEWAADGENYIAAGGAIAASTKAITADELEVIDISAALAGLEAGDWFGVRFTRLGSDALDTVTNAYFLGLYLEWD